MSEIQKKCPAGASVSIKVSKPYPAYFEAKLKLKLHGVEEEFRGSANSKSGAAKKLMDVELYKYCNRTKCHLRGCAIRNSRK